MSEVSDDGSRAGDHGGPSDLTSSWWPRVGAFSLYAPSQISAGFKTPIAVLKRTLVASLTRDVVETFQICNSKFKYSEALNPKRFLTSPSTGVLNNGYDNANSDLILHVNLMLVNMESKQRYIVKEMLGQGTFGQVAKCWVLETNSYVAVKIIKNQPAYLRQSLAEVAILNMLNNQFDPDDKHHIVRMLDHFECHKHLCISFEILGSNLFELIKMNNFKGLSLSIIQSFSQQILNALTLLKDAGIIHCDLKPENILISASVKPADIKVIDFGSACKEGQTIYSYIQSRYYRSPEVVLGYQYTASIDMWSFGCIVAELFLGLPLFPGASEFDLLMRMMEILGDQPPDNLLRGANNTSKFFKHVGTIYRSEFDEALMGIARSYRFVTEEEYEANESKRPPIGKHYFNFVKLGEIFANYPYRKNLLEAEFMREKQTRLALVDLLRGVLELDPEKRWTPLQASRHPFVTGEPFTSPYNPLPESQRIPVRSAITVDHNPFGGHWLAASISQVSNVNNSFTQNSPRFQMVPLPHCGSYGSPGSLGSFNDNAGLGSSYGSYGDLGYGYDYFTPVGPSGMNMRPQFGRPILGSTPDNRRWPQLPHGNGYGVISTGGMGPMSLGASPSQFTPPSSQMLYGPTSPARGSIHGSPNGKSPAAAQYNRRRNSVHPGTRCIQPHENASPHWKGHLSDGVSCFQHDTYSIGHVGSPRSTLSVSKNPNLRPQAAAGSESFSGITSGNYQQFPVSHAPNSNVAFDKSECCSSVPDPADWDPCYSEELLLQEDSSEGRPIPFGVPNTMRLGSSFNASTITSGVDRLNLANNSNSRWSNNLSSCHRTDGLFQAYSPADSSPPSAHDMHIGYSRLPHITQNSTRFGKQYVNGVNRLHASSMRNEQRHQKGQPDRSYRTMADTHPSENTMYPNSMSWGRRVGHPIKTTLPLSHERKDYGGSI